MKEFQFKRTKTSVGFDLNSRNVAKAVEDALPGIKFKVQCDDNKCNVVFEEDLDNEQMTALTTAISGLDRLAVPKREKIGLIDERTGQVIARGFEFPANSRQFFSLSQNAQNTLLGFKTLLEAGELAFPVLWNNKDDSDVFTIPDAVTAKAFYLAAVAAVRTALDAGNQLKIDVRAATTLKELEAVKDPR